MADNERSGEHAFPVTLRQRFHIARHFRVGSAARVANDDFCGSQPFAQRRKIREDKAARFFRVKIAEVRRLLPHLKDGFVYRLHQAPDLENVRPAPLQGSSVPIAGGVYAFRNVNRVDMRKFFCHVFADPG